MTAKPKWFQAVSSEDDYFLYGRTDRSSQVLPGEIINGELYFLVARPKLAIQYSYDGEPQGCDGDILQRQSDGRLVKRRVKQTEEKDDLYIYYEELEDE